MSEGVEDPFVLASSVMVASAEGEEKERERPPPPAVPPLALANLSVKKKKSGAHSVAEDSARDRRDAIIKERVWLPLLPSLSFLCLCQHV